MTNHPGVPGSASRNSGNRCAVELTTQGDGLGPPEVTEWLWLSTAPPDAERCATAAATVAGCEHPEVELRAGKTYCRSCDRQLYL